MAGWYDISMRIPLEAEDQGVHMSRAVLLSDQCAALICLRRRSAPQTGRWSKRLICDLNLRSVGGNFLSQKGKSRQEFQSVFLSGLTPPLFNFLQVEDHRGWAASESDPRFCQSVDKSLHHFAHTVYPVSLLSTPPPLPSALAPNPPSAQLQPSLQNGLAPGGFQNGEFLLPAQPVSIPSANGASIDSRGQPRCLHPLPAASSIRCAGVRGEGRSPPLQQRFLHVRLHVPPAGCRTTRLP